MKRENERPPLKLVRIMGEFSYGIVQHHQPIFMCFLLYLAIVVFTVPDQHTFAQENEQSENSRMHEIDSGAGCPNVPYGTLPEGETTDSQGKDMAGAGRKVVMPPNPSGPTIVDIGLFIVAITAINEIDNTFKIEGFMDLAWCDPRLAFDPDKAGIPQKIFLEEEAKLELQQIWWPDVTFVNEVNRRNVENETLIICSDGTIDYKEKFNVQLGAHYNLKKFPFDRQILEIEIESFAWSYKYLVLNQGKKKIGFSSEFEIPEWHTVDVHTKLELVKEIRDRESFSEFLMEIEVVRRSGFYIWKVFLPLSLIVGISSAVFWMKGEELSPRLDVSFIGTLTVVAYQFLISDSLPKIEYITYMDSAMMLAFMLMILTTVFNIFVNRLHLQEKKEFGMKVDRTCRWGFPLAYAVGLLISAGFYLL